MSLVFEVIQGPIKDKIFLIREGAIIGRNSHEIPLKDERVSGKHAQITLNEDGQFFLKDLDSRNGILVNGKKRTLVILKVGTEIEIGSSKLLVKEKKIKKVKPKAWKDRLVESLKKLKLKNTSPEIHPFTPAVQLKVINGLQMGTEWIVGYGPRIVGATVHDLTILEDEAPDQCFELMCLKDREINYKTSHPDIVKINNTSTSTKVLEDGDLIYIGNTQIKVSLMNEAH